MGHVHTEMIPHISIDPQGKFTCDIHMKTVNTVVYSEYFTVIDFFGGEYGYLLT